MNPYTAERLAKERTSEFRARAAQHRAAGRASRVIRNQTGWALIQIGLALVTSSAQGQHRNVRPELP
jgi:hypothetical protein